MDQPLQEKIDGFFSQYSHQTYKKGDVLIRSGDTPSGIFYLQSGTVRMYAISAGGEEIVLNVFRPISLFPLGWAINETKNRYFFEAMTECSIFKAPKDHVLSFIHENPDVLFDTLSRVFRGLDGVLQRMQYLMTGKAYQRLVVELIILSKRFSQGNTTTDVILHIKEKELAMQTGLTRETISREMKVLKTKNLLYFTPDALHIPNLSALEAELDDQE